MPSKAMEASWPRPLPASSPASLLLDLADELWFSTSVLPLPSFSLPCFPPLFSPPSPDTSTLLAQLMFSTTRHRSHSPPPHVPSSPPSSSPSRPPLQQLNFAQQRPLQLHYSHRPPYHAYAYCKMEAAPYRDGDHDNAYPAGNEKQICQSPSAGQAYHGEDVDLYSVPADYAEHEGTYPAHSDCKAAYIGDCNDQPDMIGEIQSKGEDCEQQLAFPENVSTNLGGEDALSGLYDVGVLLKDQQYRGLEVKKHDNGRQDVLDVLLPKKWPKVTDLNVGQVNKKRKDDEGSTQACREVDATCSVPYVGRSTINNGNGKRENSLMLARVPIYRQVMQELSSTEQAEMKEQLKFWAHVVASALHSKAVMQTRQRIMDS